jgi:hypothetical protein
LASNTGTAKAGAPNHAAQARQIDWLAQAEAVGQHGVDQAGDDQADQDQQPLGHAAREHRHRADADEGQGLHPGVERGRRHVLDRDAGQVQADYRDHGTGDHRRHQALDPARAAGRHDQPDQRHQRTAGNDAAQRQAQVGVGPAACKTGGRDHHADEGKGRSQVTRHLTTDQDEEDQRADAAHQDRDIGIEPHQERRQHRCAEHRDHMLHAERCRLRPGQALVGRDHDAGSRAHFAPGGYRAHGGSWFFCGCGGAV